VDHLSNFNPIWFAKLIFILGWNYTFLPLPYSSLAVLNRIIIISQFWCRKWRKMFQGKKKKRFSKVTMNFWNEFEIMSNSSMSKDTGLIILVFPGLGSIGIEMWFVSTLMCAKERLPNFSFDKNLGQEGDRKEDCLIFTKFYLWHYWLRNIWSLLRRCLATGHITCMCVQHPHPCFPTHGKNSSQWSNKHDTYFCSESSEWDKILLQVIALIMHFKFRDTRGIW